MNSDERTELLKRVNRQSATVGASIPETITVDGHELELREFLVETRKVDEIPPETNKLLSRAKQVFAAERNKRVDRLKHDQLTSDEAEQLANEIIGIDRARNALKTIRTPISAKKRGTRTSTTTNAGSRFWIRSSSCC